MGAEVDAGHLSEAVTTLLLFAGPSGAVAMVCAWLGYRRREREERAGAGAPGAQPLAMATLYADRLAIEEAARAMMRLATAQESASEVRRENTRAVEGQTRAIEALARGLRGVAARRRRPRG